MLFTRRNSFDTHSRSLPVKIYETRQINYQKGQRSNRKIADQTTNGILWKQTICKSCILYVGLSTSHNYCVHTYTDGSKESHQQRVERSCFRDSNTHEHTQLEYRRIAPNRRIEKLDLEESGRDQRMQHVATSVAILLVLAELHFRSSVFPSCTFVLHVLFVNVRGSPWNPPWRGHVKSEQATIAMSGAFWKAPRTEIND